MTENSCAWKQVEIKPYFAPLDFCKGHVDTPQGKLSVSWERQKDNVVLNAYIPSGIEAFLVGKKLETGVNKVGWEIIRNCRE